MDDTPAGLATLLMLADSRLPAGGHAHSGGVEAAVVAGRLRTVADLAVFLRGRLYSSGRLAAAVAAAACHRGSGEEAAAGRPAGWLAVLDAETDARMPSPAQRDVSRQQGRALLRAGRAAWPAGLSPMVRSAVLGPRHSPPPTSSSATGPHHSVVLGVLGAGAGAGPRGVAAVAAYLSVSGAAGAGVRLRGFDPLAVHGLLAALAPDIDVIAAAAAGGAAGPLRDLPGPAAPRLDLLAEAHVRSEVRLFAS